MKKNIAFCSIAILLIACNQEKLEDNNTLNIEVAKKNTEYNIATKNTKYSSQPYITIENGEQGITELEIQNNFITHIPDTKTDWTYFDKLYSENLNKAEKQYLGYIILNDKDLIGLAKQDTKNKTNVEALKKYVEILVTQKYSGYTVLYYALDVLKDVDSEFVKANASKIKEYAKNDTFSLDTIKDTELRNNPDKPSYVDKMVANYSYVEKIEAFLK